MMMKIYFIFFKKQQNFQLKDTDILYLYFFLSISGFVQLQAKHFFHCIYRAAVKYQTSQIDNNNIEFFLSTLCFFKPAQTYFSHTNQK